MNMNSGQAQSLGQLMQSPRGAPKSTISSQNWNPRTTPIQSTQGGQGLVQRRDGRPQPMQAPTPQVPGLQNIWAAILGNQLGGRGMPQQALPQVPQLAQMQLPQRTPGVPTPQDVSAQIPNASLGLQRAVGMQQNALGGSPSLGRLMQAQQPQFNIPSNFNFNFPF